MPVPTTLVQRVPPFVFRPGASEPINHFNLLTWTQCKMSGLRAPCMQWLSSAGWEKPFSSPFFPKHYSIAL